MCRILASKSCCWSKQGEPLVNRRETDKETQLQVVLLNIFEQVTSKICVGSCKYIRSHVGYRSWWTGGKHKWHHSNLFSFFFFFFFQTIPLKLFAVNSWVNVKNNTTVKLIPPNNILIRHIPSVNPCSCTVHTSPHPWHKETQCRQNRYVWEHMLDEGFP